MSLIKVLVVDDSAFMRKIISDMINSHKDMRVIDTARNGSEAIEKINALSPDIITLDIEMPIMDGLSALEKIMSMHSIPVLMLSSLTKEGADSTIKALNLGAVDFITKPTSIFKMNAEDLKNELVNKILIASKVKPKSYPLIKSSNQSIIFNKNTSKKTTINDKGLKESAKKIVAIGTSTGGPRALQTLIPTIPKDINASLVIVQHMPPGFTKSLAERLNSISQIVVTEAEHDEILMDGHAYIAPGDQHMRIVQENNNYKIFLGKDEPVSGHRPSVDALMNSIAEAEIENVIGVILTGMGSDGAKGLVNIKNKSGYVIAQDEESCVVFGMPKSAINLGIVDKVLPIEDISNEIIMAVEV